MECSSLVTTPGIAQIVDSGFAKRKLGFTQGFLLMLGT